MSCLYDQNVSEMTALANAGAFNTDMLLATLVIIDEVDHHLTKQQYHENDDLLVSMSDRLVLLKQIVLSA